MKWKLRGNLTTVLFMLCTTTVFAEYRAYELEVYDHIVNTSRKAVSYTHLTLPTKA